VLAYESGLSDTVDPLAGSYYVEWLTDRVEEEARRLIAEVDAAGGAVAAAESGLVRRAVEEAAYRHALRVESGEAVVVGVNRFTTGRTGPEAVVARPEPGVEEEQVAGLAEARLRRDSGAVSGALEEVRRVAAGTGNLLYPMYSALRSGATLGEVSSTLLEVFGRYRPGA
jgi:methylmalonyl-CoA mutase N-terminal domain/subunit